MANTFPMMVMVGTPYFVVTGDRFLKFVVMSGTIQGDADTHCFPDICGDEDEPDEFTVIMIVIAIKNDNDNADVNDKEVRLLSWEMHLLAGK